MFRNLNLVRVAFPKSLKVPIVPAILRTSKSVCGPLKSIFTWDDNEKRWRIYLLTSLGAVYIVANNADDEKKFFRAAQNGNLEDLKRLSSVVGVDTRHELGWTALMTASANRQPLAVKLLLSIGAKPNLTDTYHYTGHPDMHPLEVMQRREEEFCGMMNGRASYRGFTALHYAALSECTECAEALLLAEADPTKRDAAGRVPGHFASPNSRTQMLLAKHVQEWEKKIAERATEERRRFPLEQRLKQFLVGQTAAINTVSAAVRRKENGWADEEHPLVFLFLGSSGIGKTELAKQLARYLHKDDPAAFIRLDMSEYQEKHEVAKLIGAPPGYIGHDEGGQLTRRLAARPDALVLLDEVDKAHPDLLTVLLQLFDEGRLTDGKGKLIECKNAIFVMTSNLASEEIAAYGMELRREAEEMSKLKMQKQIDEGVNEGLEVSRMFKEQVVRPILKRHFGRDEFLGRINEIVYFLPFSRQELLTLVSVELKHWATKASSRHSIELTWEGGVLGCLADGYDVHYGARSIKHEVERRVVNQIANASEKGLLENGSSVLVTSDDNGKIHIHVKKRNERNYKAIT